MCVYVCMYVLDNSVFEMLLEVTGILIHIYIYVCVCVCVCVFGQFRV